jgi:hypothetical protein
MYYTLDPTKKLDDTLFIVLDHWGDGMTKPLIGDRFHYTEDWADKRIREIYKILGVNTPQAAVKKAFLLRIFTEENCAPGVAWRKEKFIHLCNPQYRISGH